jgi:hypothetical protein
MSFSSQEHPLLTMSITTWHDANVYIHRLYERGRVCVILHKALL